MFVSIQPERYTTTHSQPLLHTHSLSRRGQPHTHTHTPFLSSPLAPPTKAGKETTLRQNNIRLQLFNTLRLTTKRWWRVLVKGHAVHGWMGGQDVCGSQDDARVKNEGQAEQRSIVGSHDDALLTLAARFLSPFYTFAFIFKIFISHPSANNILLCRPTVRYFKSPTPSQPTVTPTMSLSLFNHRRRSRESTTSSILQITDKQTKSLLRERDAQITSLEKEVIALKNKIANLSTEPSAVAASMGSNRKQRQLTPYGTMVRVSTSKCSAKRRQLLAERARMGRNASLATAQLTAGNFVFLGDYVDRGMSCLECVAYLLAMKLMLPQKVFLLRGNHETRDVNGWEEHYGARSFIYQCRERFGDDIGYRIWEATNQTFDRMPLAAVIDQDIFCVHGGIPRPISDGSVQGGRIKDILNVPKVAGINPPYEHEEDEYQQVASDCIWSDPASEDQENRNVDERTGYGDSLRGGGAICFGHRAVTNFLAQQGFSYIMRAHEAHAEGVAVSKGARVFTVFSTSKDHNQGNNAMAGCILIDFEKMQVINRSPAYRNQYVHRRDSVSLAMLSEAEIAERVKLGLITHDGVQEAEEEVEDEEWEDFDEEDLNTSVDGADSSFEEEDEYILDDRRKSSVEPSMTMTSPPGSTHDNHDFMESEEDMSGRKIDFSGVDSSSRRKKRGGLSFAAISEEKGEEEDEESTVNGDDDENMEPFDDGVHC
eukprot:scaffold61_cov205-Alexandrium_tamarense.AAC.23